MKFALIGYGKMGKEIEQVIQDTQAGKVVLKITEQNLHEFTLDNLQQCDVAIEFTQPDSAVKNIYKCFEAGIPIVVGTTAWLNRLEEVRKECAAKNGALFFSPNFSIGVNLFWEANRKLAQLMNAQPQYQINMVEIHHTEKKDAPSGTAVKTAEVIMPEIDRYEKWQLVNEGKTLPAPYLPILALRQPGVPGTHTVTYTSAVDTISITHEAKSRRGFAEGAVVAAKWLVGKSGVFDMKDLLQF